MGVVQGAVSAHAAASGLKEHKPAPFHERLGRCHRAVPKREINFAKPRRAFQRGWFQKGSVHWNNLAIRAAPGDFPFPPSRSRERLNAYGNPAKKRAAARATW